ncbi:hypothetical protein HPP92_000573 [Vanilla planifolia]|uniref:Pentatricopeptide repeat-containing protein n=1 Tax=Vanilla planifolia TaxID=51239 RepID=A0A835S1M6_VANPL|nr:hypothetical protein HPP92_000573 [Vanilla planifolia]
MIAGFCEEEEFEGALEVLREMKRRGCKPEVVSYNILLMGMCRAGQWRNARDLFEDMPRRGCRPDVVTYRSLFDGMCAAGEVLAGGNQLDEVSGGTAGRGEIELGKLMDFLRHS